MPTRTTGKPNNARFKLTPQVQRQILQGVAANMPVSRVAQAVGVSSRSIFNWRGIGQAVLDAAELLELEDWRDLDDHPLGRKLDATEWACAEFVTELVKVEAGGELRLAALWTKQAADDWRAAAQLLAVRYRERWMDVRGQVNNGGVKPRPNGIVTVQHGAS